MYQETAVVWNTRSEYSVAFCNGTTSGNQTSNSGHFFGLNSIYKGPNFRDWKYRLSHGIECTTFLDGVQYDRRYKPIVFGATAKPLFDWINCGSFGPYVSGNAGVVDGANISIGPLDPTQVTIEKADNAALVKFVKRAREVQTTFQGGVFAGELVETLHMLTSPAKSLREGLSSYLRTLKKRRKQVKRVSPRKRLSAARRILADTWLEYSFGWKPFISDINDAAKLLVNARNASVLQWQPINAKGVDLMYGSSFVEVHSGSMISSIKCLVESFAKKEVVYRGQVNVEHPSNQVGHKMGTFAEDFVPTVWELIPYSFLVDYFTNIGDIISAASFLRTNLRWANRTTVDFTSSEVLSTSCDPNTSVFFAYEAWSGSVKEFRSRKQVSRAPYYGSLVPSLEFTIPGFGTKWINMAALLSGQRALVPFHR